GDGKGADSLRRPFKAARPRPEAGAWRPGLPAVAADRARQPLDQHGGECEGGRPPGKSPDRPRALEPLAPPGAVRGPRRGYAMRRLGSRPGPLSARSPGMCLGRRVLPSGLEWGAPLLRGRRPCWRRLSCAAGCGLGISGPARGAVRRAGGDAAQWARARLAGLTASASAGGPAWNGGRASTRNVAPAAGARGRPRRAGDAGESGEPPPWYT